MADKVGSCLIRRFRHPKHPEWPTWTLRHWGDACRSGPGQRATFDFPSAARAREYYAGELRRLARMGFVEQNPRKDAAARFEQLLGAAFAQRRPRRIGVHQAVVENDLPALEAALRRGEHVDKRDKCGRTPLMYAAAWTCRPLMMERLLKAGADPDARSRQKDEGATALMLAAGTTWGDVLSRPQHRASILRLLARAGADLDAQDAEGRSAIFHAVLSGPGEPDAVATLLDLGLASRSARCARTDAAHGRGAVPILARPPRGALLRAAGASEGGVQRAARQGEALGSRAPRRFACRAAADRLGRRRRGHAAGRAAAADHGRQERPPEDRRGPACCGCRFIGWSSRGLAQPSTMPDALATTGSPSSCAGTGPPSRPSTRCGGSPTRT